MIWASVASGRRLRTCPPANASVILLCRFMHSLGVNICVFMLFVAYGIVRVLRSRLLTHEKVFKLQHNVHSKEIAPKALVWRGSMPYTLQVPTSHLFHWWKRLTAF